MAPLFRISLFGLVAVPLVSAVGVRSFDAVRKDAAEDIIPEAYIVEFGDPASIINFRKYTTVRQACLFISPYTILIIDTALCRILRSFEQTGCPLHHDEGVVC